MGKKSKVPVAGYASNVRVSKDKGKGENELKEWQRLPKQLLNEHCQRSGRPRCHYKAFTKKKGDEVAYRGHVHLPDPKKKEKDLKFETQELFETGMEAEHMAALLGLCHFNRDLPLERKLPSPYKEQWLIYVQEHKKREKEDAIREAEETKRKLKEEKDKKAQSKLAPVVMSEETRSAVETALGLKDSGDASSTVSQGKGKGKSADGVMGNLERTLVKRGFGMSYVKQCIANGGVQDISSAMDWLMINVPENEIPGAYAPRKDVQIVTHAFASKPAATAVKAEDNTPEPRAGPTVESVLCGFGLNAAVARDVVAGANRDGSTSANHAFRMSQDAEAGLRTEEERREAVEEEIGVVESIYGSDVNIDYDGVVAGVGCRVVFSMSLSSDRLQVTASSKSQMNGPLHVKIGIEADSLYPDCAPLVEVRWGRADEDALLTYEALRHTDELRGEPMIFSILSWIEQNTADLLKKHAQSRLHSRPKPSGDSKQSASETSSDNAKNSSQTRQAAKPKQKKSLRKQEAKPDPALSSQLVEEEKECQSSETFKTFMKKRGGLPISKARGDILRKLNEKKVLLVKGETGCGKSTQVPQFLLESELLGGAGSTCNILVTQPRRLAALGLARRVAEERGEKVGGRVGYQVRMESAVSAATRLVFCTTGIILRRLLSEPTLDTVSHIVVDEVHERSVDSDFLLLLLKDLMVVRPDIKIILMSATIDTGLFSKYFGGCPVMEIPGRTFPVSVHYIEDVVEMVGDRAAPLGASSDNDDADGTPAGQRGSGIQSLRSLSMKVHREIPYTLIHHTVNYIADNMGEGAILVFLTGQAEIMNMMNMLTARGAGTTASADKCLVVPLYANLSLSDQEKIFKRPPKGVRKVVLATNVAETSITIDDVVYVVDTLKVKEQQYDAVSKMPTLVETWVSKQNANQRTGRAGRVREGHCFRLVPRNKWNDIADYPTPEIKRAPLEQLCLQILVMELADDVSAFLLRAIDPPNRGSIDAAMSTLEEIGATRSSSVTPLGQHLSKLPVDVRIGKTILFASMFKCVDPILTIAAAITAPKPMFVSPLDKRDEANAAKAAFAMGKSDYLAMYKAYEGWKASSSKRDYCARNFLSHDSLLNIRQSKTQLMEILQGCEFEAPGRTRGGIDVMGGPDSNANSSSTRLINAVLCAGLYANVVEVKRPDQTYHAVAGGAVPDDAKAKDNRFFTKEDGRVFIHPRSVNFSEREYESPWLVYHEKMKTSKVFIGSCTMVYPYSLLFFGGGIEVLHDKSLVLIDRRIRFKCPARTAVLCKELKGELDKLLVEKISQPRFDLAGTKVVEAIVSLLAKETIML